MIAAHYASAHRAAGEDPEAPKLKREALAALRRAARRAAAVGAPESAEGFYQAAADLAEGEAEHTSLLQAAGEMALQAGRYEAAVDLLEDVRRAHLEAGRRREAAKVTGNIGLAIQRLGRLQEAVERYTAALEVLSGEGPDADAASLNVRLGHALVFLGQFDLAEAPLEEALAVAEALDLPTVLSDALNQKAIMYILTGRAQQARHLWGAVVDIAERRGLGRELSLARTNLGNLAVLRDLPDAEEQTRAGLAVARRRGDLASESFNAGNLMMTWLLMGRWADIDELAEELLSADPDRTGTEPVHFVLALLHVLRGDPPAARAALEQMGAWERNEAEELRSAYQALELSVLLAEGHANRTVENGLRLLTHAVATLGASSEPVRSAWPAAFQAAIRMRRIDDALQLMLLLTDRAPNDVPPFLSAQLARARGLVDAAQAQDGTVHAELTEALGRFRALGAPYWTAVTQTDLAAWLIGRGRRDEAAALLDEATATLRRLGAAPALAHALDLRLGRTGDDVEPAPAGATDAV